MLSYGIGGASRWCEQGTHWKANRTAFSEKKYSSKSKASYAPTRSIIASAATQVKEQKPNALPESTLGFLSLDGDRIAKISARKQHSHPVVEAVRPLSEYMALPASQYSVLDARKIERLGENQFRCYVGRLAVLAFNVEPVIDVEVLTNERGCLVRLLNCRLDGSSIVESINNQFRAGMENRVQWMEGASFSKAICSDTEVRVLIKVPGWIPIPVSTVSSTGSAVLQQLLNASVPRFLRELERDYNRWATGDESRKPLGDGNI